MSAPGSDVATPPVIANPTVTLSVGALDVLGAHVHDVAPAHRYVVITDTDVGPLYADRARASLACRGGPTDVLTMPAGETSKTRATWARLTDEMLALGCGRDTTIVALGGGAVGDVAGFVAATYLRGVPIVQVPTTLLAMIDAAIGGKTGVDTPAGKNLVGAFHPPAAVIVDPALLDTLPIRQLRAGMAEAIKHGVIADAAYFAAVTSDLALVLAPGGTRHDAMMTLIAGSVGIKSAVVAADAREAGRRKILNFGHTIGHAIETATNYTLLHGEAVAIGMAVESRLAELAGVAACGVTDEICRALDAASLPSAPPAGLNAATIVDRTHTDKKARAGTVAYALPRTIGEMAAADTGWVVSLPDAFVLEMLTHE